MIPEIADFFAYTVPWWAWAIPAAGGAVGVFLLLSRLVGLRNALLAVAIYVVGALIALSNSRGRQRGWQDRIKKDNRDADRLIEKLRGARDRARRDAADPDSLFADDGFKRD